MADKFVINIQLVEKKKLRIYEKKGKKLSTKLEVIDILIKVKDCNSFPISAFFFLSFPFLRPSCL